MRRIIPLMNLSFLSESVTGLVSLIWPPHCLICQAPLGSETDQMTCVTCLASMPKNPQPWCPTCGLSLLGWGKETTHCVACLQKPSPLTWARAATLYQGTAKASVGKLKFHHQVNLADPMARAMAEVAQTPPTFNADLLIPVPLHTTRERQRGFNQSALLADALSPQLKIPVAKEILIRSVATEAQTKLNATGRRQNVLNAFKVSNPVAIQNKHLLLIDDVMTTGSTLFGCAEVLALAGAKTIGALAFARG